MPVVFKRLKKWKHNQSQGQIPKALNEIFLLTSDIGKSIENSVRPVKTQIKLE